MNVGTFAIIAILVVVGLIIYIVVLKSAVEKHNEKKPLVEAFGLILQRSQTGEQKMMDIAQYHVQIGEKERIWLASYHDSEMVPIEPGDYGELSYRGKMLVSFNRTGTLEKSD